MGILKTINRVRINKNTFIMKTRQVKRIDLQKVTIATISPNAMQQIKGGDCVITDVRESIDHCKPDPTIGID